VTGKWKDDDGVEDATWWGLYYKSEPVFAYFDFSTYCVSGITSCSVNGGVTDFEVTAGGIHCPRFGSDALPYISDDFNQSAATLDASKWDSSVNPVTIVDNKCSLYTPGGTRAFTPKCTVAGDFDIQVDYSIKSVLEASNDTFQFGIKYDAYANYAEFCDVYVNYASNAAHFSVWGASRHSGIYQSAETAGVTLGGKLRMKRTGKDFVISAYTPVGGWEVLHSRNNIDLVDQQLTFWTYTGPPYSNACDAYFDNLTWNSGTILGGCIANDGVGGSLAIDIRQASVHAEDMGNKETMNRIRHKDSRMMLFTNDDNARWGAAQNVRTLSVPLRTIGMKMGRRGLLFMPGTNFRYTSEKYGITEEIIFKTLNVKEGNLGREEFFVNAIEDANYLTQIVNVSEADRSGTKLNQFLLDVKEPAITEAPYSLVGENMYLLPLVSRQNGNELGYHLYMSTDGTSYTKQGSFSKFTTGGSLTDALPVSKAVLDNVNTLTVDFDRDSDAANIETISRADMLSGKNLGLLITSAGTEEIITFDTISPTTGITGRYEMTGLYRGRFDTEQINHRVNSKFFFLGVSFPIINMPGLFKGNSRIFKFIYYNSLESGEIADAGTVPYEVEGRAWTPYAPGNFRCNETSPNTPGGAVYVTPISLSWDPDVRGQGAGNQDPDVVVDAFPVWEGLFEVLATIGSTVAFTDTAIDALTAAYTDGQVKAWNGGTLPDEITFKLTNYITTDGVKYESPYNTLIVNKE
jgi:hypothetical protein